MPELPEVQTVVNDLKNHILGKTIYSVEILWPKTIHTPIATDFAADLKNAKIENITRRGKFIVIKVASKSTRHSLRVTRYWLTHLRMTGQFRVHDDAKLNTNIDKDIKHLRVKIHFTDGSELIFIDSRKFARMYLVEAVDAITGKLGIEPLEIELKEFQNGSNPRNARSNLFSWISHFSAESETSTPTNRSITPKFTRKPHRTNSLPHVWKNCTPESGMC